jgi:hypothetical protein
MLRYLLLLLLYYRYCSEDIPINKLILIIPKNDTDIYPKNDTDIYPKNVKYTLRQPPYFDYI